ncbi:MAG: tyrosine-type recombinase/integrase [Actinomycetota bacterium]
MASIREHHGKFQVLYRDPVGRQRARSFARKTDAKAFAAAVETDKRRSEWMDPRLAKVRFSSFAEEWFATKADLRPRPRVNVEGRLRNHILPAFGNWAIGGIQPSDVRSWIASLSAKGLAPATVRAIVLTFGQIIDTAQVDGYVARSPMIGTKQSLPKEASHEEMHFLAGPEIQRLAEAITPRFRVAIYAAGYLGLRDGELWATKTANLRDGTLRVDRSLTQVRSRGGLLAGYTEIRPGLVLGPTKTGKVRSMLVPRFLLDMLDEQLAQFPPTKEGFIFSAALGGPVWHRNFYGRHFKPAVAAAGLTDELRFHDLRHSCAALLIGAGRHIEEVKQYLGHSSIRVTSDRYGHLFPTAKEAMREGLDRMFEASRAPGPEPASEE